MEKYNWWGNSNEPPPHLKTKKQLADLGLSPLKPVGIIETQKYDVLLYDINDPKSCRPKRKSTPKQLETLAANREKVQISRDYKAWLKSRARIIESDRVAAVIWARHEMNQNDWVILDTETTGLHDAEIVEIAILGYTGETLLDTLVRPTIPIPTEVTEIHGITDSMVVSAPTFPEVHPKIVEVLMGKRIFIYNASFDIGILNYCRNLHKLPSFYLQHRSECLMEWVAQWVGNWDSYHESYRWPRLNGGHRGLGDCLAVLEKIREMATDSDKIYCPVPRPDK